MEGTVITVPNKPGQLPEKVDIDTSEVLFIVGGAFIGLDDVVMQRVGKNRIGFTELEIKDKDLDWRDHLQTIDLVKYGLIPEFMGRFPILTSLHELDRVGLRKILIEPKNSVIRQFEKLFTLNDIVLTFTEDAIEAIADVAFDKDLGARGLRGIIEKLLIEHQYNINRYTKDGVSEIVIEKETVLNNKEAKLIYNNERS